MTWFVLTTLLVLFCRFFVILLAMPSYCCVPNCNQFGYASPSGKKVNFFNFPKAPLIRKQWIHAIRRDEGKDFVITERTKVCSLHFRPEDLRKKTDGSMSETVVCLSNLTGLGLRRRKEKPRLNENRFL